MPCPLPGLMPMPDHFAYRRIFEAGKPVHGRWDEFSLKHPPMDPGRRAKIFAPFDALRGFQEAIRSRETEYRPRIILEEGPKQDLDRKLRLLARLTENGPALRRYRPQARVTYFVPAEDPDRTGSGQYRTVSGPVTRADGLTHTLTADGLCIPFEDLLSIEDIQARSHP